MLSRTDHHTSERINLEAYRSDPNDQLVAGIYVATCDFRPAIEISQVIEHVPDSRLYLFEISQTPRQTRTLSPCHADSRTIPVEASPSGP